MCGILFTDDSSVSRKTFNKALQLMHHRGPDAQFSYYRGDKYKLGHTRLKILDLDDRSNQPFISRDKKYVMVFNGEIYNYNELAKEYSIETRTTSDTEVLIELYILLGSRMLQKLNGMFSFVILDTITGSVFAARDRLGIKPLYYSISSRGITIASEIASVVEIVGDIEIDEIGLRQYRKLRAFFNGRTLYSGIKMFQAGHFFLNGEIKRFWKLPVVKQKAPDDEEIYELLKSAVDYRRLSDVSVGSFLSGGLDSTIITGLAKEPHTWTVGFKDCNEFDWARIASDKIKSIHSEVLIENDEFTSLARQMIKKRREPLSVPNEVLLYKMTREVKEYNTVILSGEGADELFFGYDRIFRWANENEWDIKEFSKLYAYGSNDDYDIVEDAVSPFLHYGKAIDIVAAFFQIAHLHGLLRRLDNSTMLCSVEARVPFVDHRLVERMAGVSFDNRMEKGIVKSQIKRVFSSLVPQQIVNRQKIGFPVPLNSIDLGEKRKSLEMDKWLEFNLRELGVVRC
jgi:asparagine synthase (glutamine-hydrolysing)